MSIVEFIYNSQQQESIEQTPFEVDLGYLSRNFIDHTITSNKNEKAKKLIDILEANRRTAINALLSTQD